MAKSKKRKRNASSEKGSNEPDYTADSSAQSAREQKFTEAFSFAARGALEMRRKSPDDPDLEYLDEDPVRNHRRRDTALRHMDQVKERVAGICPELLDVLDVEEEWARINSLLMGTYDICEGNFQLIIAVSLWLLDRIRENWNEEGLSAILPNTLSQLQDLDCPEIYDPGYSREIIEGTMWIIYHRNDDCTGLKIPACPEGLAPRVFMDDYTAAGLQHQDVPSRQRFEELLSLAGLENLKRAAGCFEQKMWEITDCYFTFRAQHIEEKRRIREQLDRYDEKVRRVKEMVYRESGKAGQKRKQTSVSVPQVPLVPLAKQTRTELPAFTSDSFRHAPLQNMQGLREQIEELERENDEICENLTQMGHQDNMRSMSFCGLINCSREKLTELLGEGCAELLTGFDVGDPWEMSAGFLYLVDTGSDLPWLYYPGMCVVRAVAGRLPWYKRFYDPEYDTFWYGDYETDVFNLSEEDTRPESLHVPEPPDWYALDYVSRFRGETDLERTNLAQIIYAVTGGVLPRDTHRYDDAAIILKRFGITGKKALSPILQVLGLLGEGENRSTIEYDWSDPEKEEVKEEETEETEDPEVYKQMLRDMKAQNDSLKRAQYAAAREARDLRRKMEEQKEAWKADQRELANLRELVYMQAQGTEEEDQPERQIAFPYRTVHRMVVFGGHDSWLKTIRPMLPDVRFMGPDILPNADLIRYSDMVWIQPNVLSHAAFYRIIDVVRKNHVPIRYFSSASAVKCAEDLVRADLEELE